MRHNTRGAGGLLAAGFLGLVVSSVQVAEAQAAPGTRLTVDVQVASVATVDGVTRISYRLANQAGSEEQVLTFVVDAPAPALEVVTPSPEIDWTTGTQFGSRSVAMWGVLGDDLEPGTVGPLLSTTAKGLPGLVRYWVQGYAPPPPLLPTDDGDVPPTDVLATQSLTGMTVGVVPAPVDVTPGALAARLQGLLTAVCEPGGMITHKGTCTSLRAKLNAAETALSHGSGRGAQGALQAFFAELDAQHGKHIPDAAYWLLTANMEVISATLR